MKNLFPYEKIRPVQKQLMQKIDEVIKNSTNLIVHAPTGLGKTVAALCPALNYALKNKLTILFLTSRHTQHIIAVETLKEINQKFSVEIKAIDIIGKKWMCPVPGIETLYSSDFADYCRAMREEGKCEYYANTRNGSKLTPQSKQVIEQLSKISPSHSEKIVEICSEQKLCPYEITTELSKSANVIIADYYYVFNPAIREIFFRKSAKELQSSIVIVDEAHNLPARIRNLMTQRTSTYILDRAIREARKFSYKETERNLSIIKNALLDLAAEVTSETIVSKNEFMNKIDNYEQLIEDFHFIADAVREQEKQSFIGSVANFLKQWQGPDQGFVRILAIIKGRRDNVVLSYRCLDPSLITAPVIAETHSTILMSGTLTPLEMYKDILGFEKAELEQYKSPFPDENKLTMIIPETTTKFSMRNEAQYKRIAAICSELIDSIPGNTIIFFPSYYVRDQVNKSLVCKKTTFVEMPSLSKSEKKETLENFKSYNAQGAVLLAVVSGSFGEGIDLPGDYLKAVVVVGLPLNVPDLETKALIKYYDEQFSKGWDYGYIFPAMNKVMQNAGRVIRSETDRGAIIFLEERYSWHHYKRCFPLTWKIVTTKLYKERLDEFFKK
ncbi:MAG: ATP-dependent DNA helicase [Candidatus Woesearchaeota archaeon]